MIYFTSDLHLGHEKIISSCNRPFDNAYDMNKSIIESINDVVTNKDILYILGDISLGMPKSDAEKLLRKLKCKKVLIKGNHDPNYDKSIFSGIYDYKEIKYNGRHIVLMHYPLMSWKDMELGTIHLHGHLHSNEDYNIDQRENGLLRYDVGVDVNNYKPVSIEDILMFFNLT